MGSEGHLIIDGYNVAHAWPTLRGLVGRRREAVGGRLLDAVRVIHDFSGKSLTLVFDGDGATLTIDHPDDGVETLTVVYAPQGVTADGVIERLLARAGEVSEWTVATADRAIIQTAQSYGAHAISPQELADWVERVEAQQTRWLQRQRNEVDRDWLGR
jgi:predicted RNA-binding protein with PIN domain